MQQTEACQQIHQSPSNVMKLNVSSQNYADEICWSFAKAETEARGKYPLYNTGDKYSASHNQG